MNEAVEQTEAEDDDAPVSNRVRIVSGFGSVNENERIDYVNFTVMRGAGSGDIDLTSATVKWSGPDTETTLTYGEQATANRFAVAKIKDSNDSLPVLDGRGDRFTLTMNAEQIRGGLNAGAVVELRITLESGAVTLYRVNVPRSLEGEQAVTV
ncbi:flagellin [Haladaptatus pallidirubidus]|uniref:Uncharacterized protein n=1 Tax=Haladaptatus pallidirubidus TaxID=1008152 RepID=A0AAV3UKE9_9EURY|nr:flagellin [Haladaptatus pallidirubidus]